MATPATTSTSSSSSAPAPPSTPPSLRHAATYSPGDETSTSAPMRVVVATPEGRKLLARVASASMILPQNRPAFGMDCGGTLCKLIYFKPLLARSKSVSDAEELERTNAFITDRVTYGTSGSRNKGMEFYSPTLQGTLHFIQFETRRMPQAVEMIRAQGLNMTNRLLCATGGGAHKYEALFKDKLGMQLMKYDELETLISGLSFMVDANNGIENECFYLDNFRYGAGDAICKNDFMFDNGDKGGAGTAENIYPYMVVNIGTGVSIMKVAGPGREQHTRVGGSSLGGGTFFGIVSAFCGVQSFEEALELCRKGDNKAVDLLVGDIYGGDYVGENFKLRSTVVASSFGKLARAPEESTTSGGGGDGGDGGGGSGEAKKQEGGADAASRGAAGLHRHQQDPADVARATLTMIATNVATIAWLHAKSHGTNHIIFTGSFLRGNIIAMRTLSYYIDMASRQVAKALFLRHDGYFGAMGALLHHFADEDDLHQEFLAKEKESGTGTGWHQGGKGNSPRMVGKREQQWNNKAAAAASSTSGGIRRRRGDEAAAGGAASGVVAGVKAKEQQGRQEEEGDGGDELKPLTLGQPAGASSSSSTS